MEITQEKFKLLIKETLSECLESKEQKLTLTIDDASKLSGIGRDKILELAHNSNSGFPSFRVGSKFLINREKLINWLDKISDQRLVI
jgi:excisionase family DNA binding protein